MTLVMTLLARGDADAVDAQLAYHLNAGVDFVVATGHESPDATAEVLESYARDGVLRLLREQGELPEGEWRTRMARLAATDHGADWVIDADGGEFWLPRAESLKDALVAIPPRYRVVQALVRRFVPRPGDGFFADRLTIRRALAPGSQGPPVAHALRPVYRADAGLVVVPRGTAVEAWRVPLRGWYPIEVFELPTGDEDHLLEEDRVARGLEDGSLVSDTRLADALRSLREQADAGRSFPRAGAAPLRLPIPSIVDDAQYAVECAALGEVDFDPLERHIADLEQRLARLEAGFWPRIFRRLARLRRSRR